MTAMSPRLPRPIAMESPGTRRSDTREFPEVDIDAAPGARHREVGRFRQAFLALEGHARRDS